MIKRFFDISISLVGLIFLGWLIILTWLITSIDNRSNGFFIQKRIGRYSKQFHIIKLKTMRDSKDNIDSSHVTISLDPRITPIGAFMRKFKLDELPQLINILLGHMSFVGPRPDVPGFADELEGEDRIILSIRPGITAPSTLYFRNEEYLLQQKKDPISYNKNVIWPKKVKMNKEYARNYNLKNDLLLIFKTIFQI
ncbi:sugar transferase [bacterium]|nr:sugar transferase [bacterium]